MGINDQFGVTCEACGHQNLFKRSLLAKHYNQKVSLSCSRCQAKTAVLLNADFFNRPVAASAPQRPATFIMNAPDTKPGDSKIARLKVFANDYHEEQIFPLREGNNVIGRKSDTSPAEVLGITTRDTSMSRKHCLLTVSMHQGQYRYLLQDQDSLNGVFCQGQKLTPKEVIVLDKNTVLTIGATQICLI